MRFPSSLAVAIAVLAVGGASGATSGRTAWRIEDLSPAWSPRGDRVAFVRRIRVGSSFVSAVLVARRDGALLARFDGATQFAWSPNGKYLAFVWTPPDDWEELRARLFVTTADGTRTREIGGGAQPAWSPSSRHIAFTRYERSDSALRATAFVVRRDGTGLRRVSLLATESYGTRWSPDGRTLAFVGRVRRTGGGLYVVRRDGARLRRVLAAAPNVARDGAVAGRRMPLPARWSPDGALLLSSLYPDRVVVVPTHGGAPREIGRAWAPTWSPDGRRLALVVGCQVVVVRAAGTVPDDRPHCSAETSVGAPVWSPRGDRIAFHLCIHEHCFIFATDAKTLARRRLAYGSQPAWSRDGRRLVFVSSRRRDASSAPPRIWVMNADGTGARSLTPPARRSR